jgi:hypothetical protein
VLNLSYASVARQPSSAAQRQALIMKSRVNNQRVGVTGALLYRSGRFIQVVEGEAAAVRALLARIAADPRHGELVVLHEATVAQRQFPDWSLGYFELPGGPMTQPTIESVVDRMLAGTAVARTPEEGSKLIRGVFRTFAVEQRAA